MTEDNLDEYIDVQIRNYVKDTDYKVEFEYKEKVIKFTIDELTPIQTTTLFVKFKEPNNFLAEKTNHVNW